MQRTGRGGYPIGMSEAMQDRRWFGTLESSGKNREKVLEASYGYEQPEGVFRAGVLRDRDDVDGGVPVRCGAVWG
jgi:hypothetical protein